MRFTVIGTHDAERVQAQAVTPSYFDVLGITPILGRRLSPDSTVPPSEVVLQLRVLADALRRLGIGARANTYAR